MLGIKPRKKNQFKNGSPPAGSRIRQIIAACGKTLGMVALVVVMSFTFVFIHDLLNQCAYFKVETIQVSGAQRLSVDQILEYGGIRKDTNILSINLRLIRTKLMAHPWIADADISRRLPNGIRIRVVEQTPLAIVDLGRRFILNTRGDIFKEWSASDPDHLPVISGIAFSDLKLPGEPAPLSFRAVMSVLMLGQQNGSILPNHQVREIHVDRQAGLTLFPMDKGKTIRLGYGDYPNKYTRLAKILDHLKLRRDFSDFESIDLNNPNRIVVHPLRIESPEREPKEV